jgi:HEAT repeat protein
MTALALALTTLAESCVCALAPATSAVEQSPPDSSVDRLNERLRDALDRGLVALDRPDEAERLGRALRSVARRGGPEVAADLGALANDARLSRLVRSQLALMLGLLATPNAVQTLVGLLAEMDVLIRQSVNQAFVRLGEAGRAPLVAALDMAEERVRDRAGEVLRLLKDPAGATALTRTPAATQQAQRKNTTRRRSDATTRRRAQAQ